MKRVTRKPIKGEKTREESDHEPKRETAYGAVAMRQAREAVTRVGLKRKKVKKESSILGTRKKSAATERYENVLAAERSVSGKRMPWRMSVRAKAVSSLLEVKVLTARKRNALTRLGLQEEV